VLKKSLIRLLVGVALGASAVQEVGNRVVGSSKVSSSARVRGNPAGPLGAHDNGSVVAHAVDDRSLGRSVKPADVVESVLGLSILGELDRQISVARNSDFNLERSVTVNGASVQRHHASAAPGVAARSSADLSVHRRCSKLVTVALHDIKLNAGVALGHEGSRVVAVKVAPRIESAGNHKVQVGVDKALDLAQVDSEHEPSSEKVELLLRVVAHASLTTEAVRQGSGEVLAGLEIGAVVLLDQVDWLPVARDRGWRVSGSWRRSGPRFAAVGPAVGAVRGLASSRGADPATVARSSLQLGMKVVGECCCTTVVI